MSYEIPEYLKIIKCDTTKKTKPFKCAVSCCQNKFTKFCEKNTIKFHKFPDDPDMELKWKDKCGLKEMDETHNLMVCSDHFSPDDYERNFKAEFSNPRYKRKLKNTAIPSKNFSNTLYVPNKKINSEKCKTAIDTDTVKLMDFNIQERIQIVPAKLEDSYITETEVLFNNQDVKDSNNIGEKKDQLESLRLKHLTLKSRLKKIESRIKYRTKQKNHLNNLLAERSKYSKFRCNILLKVFSPAQISLLIGNKKVYWSEDDLAKAFVLRHMGTKESYLYLKQTLNYPLPSLSSVQKWAAST